MKNYYDVLGIGKNASKEEIRKAFKLLSIKYHPDKTGGNEYYTELFKNINEAHQVLSNEVKKREYDTLLINYSMKQVVFKNNLHAMERDDVWAAGRISVKKQVIKTAGIPGGIAFLLFVFIMLFKTNENDVTVYAATTGENKPFEYQTARYQAEFKPKTVITQPSQPLPQPSPSPQPQTQPQPSPQPHPSPQPSPSPTVEMKTIFTKLVTTKELPVLQSKSTVLKEESPAVNTISKKEEVHPDYKLELSIADKEKIMKDVEMQKALAHSTTKSVKIYMTSGSNITNGWSVASYFKEKGLTISGRETINKTISGINIEIINNCIIVTIGKISS